MIRHKLLAAAFAVVACLGLTVAVGTPAYADAPQSCNQLSIGKVCVIYQADGWVVGKFINNSGGANTLYFDIVKSPSAIVKTCSWVTIPAGDTANCVYKTPVHGAQYKNGIHTASGGIYDSGWITVP